MNLIGFAKLKDTDSFKEWIEEEGLPKDKSTINTEAAGWWRGNWTEYGYAHQALLAKDPETGKTVKNLFDNSYTAFLQEHAIQEFFQFVENIEKEGQKLHVYYRDHFAIIVGYENTRYIMPSEWFDFTPLKDYDALTASEMLMLSDETQSAKSITKQKDTMEGLRAGKSSIKKAEETLSLREKEILSGEEESLCSLKEQIDKLKKEMEERQKLLMEEIEKKKAELEEKKQDLENRIYILDTQIYSIRCYTGEVVSFHSVREGKKAAAVTPAVLYQKIRFLDEELGKYLSLYEYDGSSRNKESFISALKNREDLFDLFTPAEKCISVVKVSRTGKTHYASEAVANLLDEYEILHGTQLGVLIRNGENLWIGWMDDERVDIKNENAFFSPDRKSEVIAADESDVKNTSTKEKVSRLFLFSMLQGIIDHTNYLSFPEKINITKPGPYITLSLADGWITDTRYGTFSDILKKSSGLPIKKGDAILVGLRVTRDDGYRDADKAWSNSRGRGEKNRTHSASVPYGVNIINLVEEDLAYELTYDMEEGIIETVSTEVQYQKASKDNSRPGSSSVIENICKTVSADVIKPTGKIIGKEKEIIVISSEERERIRRIKYLEQHENDEALIREVTRYKNSEDTWYYKDENYTNRILRSNGRSMPARESFSFGGFWKVSKTESEKPHFKKRYVSIKLKEKTPHYYISTKTMSHAGTSYPVNMEVFSSEFINLTYLCSTWVEYVITTGNLGDFKIASEKISYAEALKTLKKAETFLKSREEAEKVLLKKYGLTEWVAANPDWPAILTDWRIEKKIRRLTDSKAVLFSKIVHA